MPESTQPLHTQHQLPLVDWRSIYFQQSHALSFNGINDYVLLPVGLLHQSNQYKSASGSQSHGLTIDIMFLGHKVPNSFPLDQSASTKRGVIPPAGGMLYGCQDREFGRSRRAARLHTLPLLYIGTDGHLRSAVGPMRSSVRLAGDQWHRVTLTMVLNEAGTRVDTACMYIDGVLDEVVHEWDFSGIPSYSVLGSGITEGYPCGASTPVYNCHSFHGLIDELRLWARALQPYEVSLLVHCVHASAPYACCIEMHDMSCTTSFLYS